MRHAAGLHCLLTEGFGKHLSTLAIRRKSAEHRELCIVGDDLLSFLAVGLFELCKALNDCHDADFSGTSCREHRLQSVDLGKGAELITVEHDTVRQAAAVLIRNDQNFPIELLDQKAHHEVLGDVLLGHDNEHRRFLRAEFFCIHRRSEAQDLLHFRVQKAVQPGQCGR